MNSGDRSQDGKILTDSRQSTPESDGPRAWPRDFMALKIDSKTRSYRLGWTPPSLSYVSHGFFIMGRNFGGLVSWRRGYSIKNNDVTVR